VARARGRSGRPWRRRHEEARDAALRAREAAADAFLRLDTAQRDLALSLETLKAVADEDPGTRDATLRFAALAHAADEVSADYIAVMDRHRLDPEGDGDEVDTSVHTAARHELEAVRDRLAGAEEDLARFAASIGPVLARAEGALARVPAAAARAREAVTGARDALAAAGDLAGRAHAERVAALEAAARELDRGAGALGVAEYLALADRVAADAPALRDELAALPALRDDVTRRLTSLRTRAQAVESRAAGAADALAALRRAHPARAWRDLEDTPQVVARALATAGARLDEAARAVAEHAWPDAVSRLATVKAALADADEAMGTVRERLRALTEVAADPGPELERTSFAIRDAQRLALAGRAHAEERYATRLDALVHRFEVAREQLEVPHPDWWAFLSETAAVRQEVAAVVRDIREDRARP
jgi:hypothetical protein